MFTKIKQLIKNAGYNSEKVVLGVPVHWT